MVVIPGEEEDTTEVVQTCPEMVHDSRGKLVEKPEYGGTINLELYDGKKSLEMRL